MMRVVIIDDMEQARRTLADDIAAYCPELVVIGEASSVKTGAALVQRLKPDLVFLDIQLEDGTGFDMLEALDSYEFRVIFTTALDSYGIRAVRVSAIDYLLKPIDPDDLVRAVNRAKSVLAASTNERVDVLMDTLHNPGASRRIALNTAERMHIVPTEEIVRCESQRNYTLFHLTGNRRILVTRTLKEFDEMLVGYGFFRAHHSHVVNISHVREYLKSDGCIVMSDGSTVQVATRKKDALLQALGV